MVRYFRFIFVIIIVLTNSNCRQHETFINWEDNKDKYVMCENNKAIIFINIKDIQSAASQNDDAREILPSLSNMTEKIYKMKGEIAYYPIKIPNDISEFDLSLNFVVNEFLPDFLKRKKAVVYDKSLRRFSTYSFKKKDDNYIAVFNNSSVFYSIPTYLYPPIIYN